MIKCFNTSFYRLEIAIARDDVSDRPDVIVPLVAKKSLFGTQPRKGDPVRGHFWLQGYCVSAGGNEKVATL